MNIKQTADALRANQIEIDNTRPGQQIRLTRLYDKRHDLEARLAMLLRKAGLEPA